MLLILILGAFLRLWGIGFGLPFIYHPDEHDLSYPAMVASLNRMHPGGFGLPSFMIDLLGGIYLVYFGILRLLGDVSDASGFYRLYQAQPGLSIFWGGCWPRRWALRPCPRCIAWGAGVMAARAACWPCSFSRWRFFQCATAIFSRRMFP